MEDCIFCKVIAGELPSTKLYEDAEIVVIKNIHPEAPVHWLVIPKKHIPELLGASEEIVVKLMAVVNKIIRDQGIEKYRIVINGKGAALVDHLHIHVMGKIDKKRSL